MRFPAKRFRAIAIALFLAVAASVTVLADTITASSMRLLSYEGAVDIADSSGKAKTLMKNVRFASGDVLSTGTDGLASVGLDSSKVLTVDHSSKVGFSQSGKQLKLSLEEGSLLLDVQKKLDANESLDIETSTMLVGIRGTIVWMQHENTANMQQTTLGVLEGTAEVNYTDETGTARKTWVDAGNMLTVVDANKNDLADIEPAVRKITPDDISGFVSDQLVKDPAMYGRVQSATGILEPKEEAFANEDDWTWDGTVTFVAHSASKIYDGAPLTWPGDVLVYGLPSGMSAQVMANGSQTDVGTSQNVIAGYVIYNSQGEDVTSHFTNIQTVSGNLVVDPMPITIWTGSAEKVYDGTPLTNPNAGVNSFTRHDPNAPVWRNSSYVESASGLSRDLYGVSGSVFVHGTNPVTGETKEIELFAGQKMSVYLSDQDGEQTIELKTEKISEAEIPESILYLYKENPALLTQAVADTGWNKNLIDARIKNLPEDNSVISGANGLLVNQEEDENIMLDAANVRINIDTTITDYNDRALGIEETNYTGIKAPAAIHVRATGSQTEVGESINTYEIDWAGSNPSNYIVSENLGTLRVTGGQVIITTGSAEKVYDGTPLTNEEASITGLLNGDTAVVTATGSQTEIGESFNTYEINWGSTDSSKYEIVENLGILKVTDPILPAYSVVFAAGSASKNYDGRPLTCKDVTVVGLPAGYTYTAETSGSQTNYGTSPNKVSSYAIYDGTGADVTSDFAVSTLDGTLTVNQVGITITTGSAIKEYDGTPLTNPDAWVSGLVNGESVYVVANGSITNVGTTLSTYDISWGGTNRANYYYTENLGTLEVTEKIEPEKITGFIILTAGSSSKIYDGTALTNGNVTAEGLPSGYSIEASTSGSQTDAGESKNVVSSYKILDASGRDVTSDFEITTVDGSLKVTAAKATIKTGSASKPYDGTPLANSEASITGLVNGETATVTATGTITEVGTTDNTYTIEWGTAKSSNYEVTEELGTLEVTEAEILGSVTITAGSASKTYDGTALTNNNVTAEGLPSGYSIEAATSGSQTDVGESKNVVSSYKILDASGTDVTSNFEITTVDGSLKVTAANATITTGSASKPYDGTPLTSSEASITGLVNGETATVTATGTITEIGTADNTYTIKWGTAKSSNYEVTEELGTLEVTEAEILGSVSITAGSASKTYDGTALTEDTYTVEGLPEGYTCTVAVTGSQTDAGDGVNTVSSYTITDASANDVTSSFDVTTTDGTLTVSKATLTVTTGSIDKVFDGKALTNSEASIDGLISGETATVTATGSITDAGSTNNTYTIEWGTAKESNYTITENLGKLTVTPLIITFDLCQPDEEWYYDGEPFYFMSEWIEGYYDYESEEVPGKEISGEDVVYVEDEEEALVGIYRDFLHLKGGGEVRVQCDAIIVESAGEYTMTPVVTFTKGSSGNYSITYVRDTTVFRKLG